MPMKNTKAWLKNRAKRGVNRDGGGKVKKPQTHSWTCSAVKGLCPMKPHPRIGCAVHGSAEEAARCNARSAAIIAAGEFSPL